MTKKNLKIFTLVPTWVYNLSYTSVFKIKAFFNRKIIKKRLKKTDYKHSCKF